MRFRPGYAGAFLLALSGSLMSSLAAQELPALRMSVSGPAQVMFDPKTDACSPVDMPDVNPRAFRAADGSVVMFALHFVAHALRGPNLGALKIDCRSALDSHEDADPARYDGRRYLTSVWTPDGTRVAALIHNEYHADVHPGRCTFKTDLACWYNSVLAFQSGDGAKNFLPSNPLVVAAAPFKQDVGQGRHRGFFNPSNMFAKDGFVYAFVSTTGWDGQNYGACLMRNANPLDSAGWRAWSGRDFFIRWRDPYRNPAQLTESCAPLAPFGFPVGSVVLHRGSGNYIAVWEVPRVEGRFPVAGFYMATSRDLLNWSAPSLLLPGATMHDPCGTNNSNRDGSVIAYPAVLDTDAQGRNFDNTGDAPWLFYTRVKVEGCNPGAQRVLVRQKIAIDAIASSSRTKQP